MERIRLTKSEKEAMRIVEKFGGRRPATYPAHVFNSAIMSLIRKGLVHAKFLTTGDACKARLSEEGKAYLSVNPDMKNPIDWKMIGAITGILSLIVSIIALFVSCMN